MDKYMLFSNLDSMFDHYSNKITPPWKNTGILKILAYVFIHNSKWIFKLYKNN